MDLNNNNKDRKEMDTCEEDDDDVPKLSADTLRALQEFYAETENKAEEIDEDWVFFNF